MNHAVVHVSDDDVLEFEVLDAVYSIEEKTLDSAIFSLRAAHAGGPLPRATLEMAATRGRKVVITAGQRGAAHASCTHSDLYFPFIFAFLYQPPPDHLDSI